MEGVTKTWNGMGRAGTEVTCSGTVFTWSHMFVTDIHELEKVCPKLKDRLKLKKAIKSILKVFHIWLNFK